MKQRILNNQLNSDVILILFVALTNKQCHWVVWPDVKSKKLKQMMVQTKLCCMQKACNVLIVQVQKYFGLFQNTKLTQLGFL